MIPVTCQGKPRLQSVTSHACMKACQDEMKGGMNIHLFDNLTTAAWPFISNPPHPLSTYAIPDFAAFVLAKERSHSLTDRRDKGGHPVVKEIVFYGQMHISFLPNRFKTNLTLGGETLWWQGNAAKMKVVHKSDVKCAEFPFFFY